MTALSPRHEALFDQLNCVVSEMVSISKLREILNKRFEQVELILADKSMSEKTLWMAQGEFHAIRAVKADIDALLGRR